jgi:hypothetical protein
MSLLGAERKASATAIEAAFRGHKQREDIKEKQHSAEALQGAFRMHQRHHSPHHHHHRHHEADSKRPAGLSPTAVDPGSALDLFNRMSNGRLPSSAPRPASAPRPSADKPSSLHAFAAAAEDTAAQIDGLQAQCDALRAELEEERAARGKVEIKFEAVTRQIMAALDVAERNERTAREMREAQRQQVVEVLKKDLDETLSRELKLLEQSIRDSQHADRDAVNKRLETHQQRLLQHAQGLAEAEAQRGAHRAELQAHAERGLEMHKRQYTHLVEELRREHAVQHADLRGQFDAHALDVSKRFEDDHTRTSALEQAHAEHARASQAAQEAQRGLMAKHREEVLGSLRDHTSRHERLERDLSQRLDAHARENELAHRQADEARAQALAQHKRETEELSGRHRAEQIGQLKEQRAALEAQLQDVRAALRQRTGEVAQFAEECASSVGDRARKARAADAEGYALLLGQERAAREAHQRDIDERHERLAEQHVQRLDAVLEHGHALGDRLEKRFKEHESRTRNELERHRDAHNGALERARDGHAQALKGHRDELELALTQKVRESVREHAGEVARLRREVGEHARLHDAHAEAREELHDAMKQSLTEVSRATAEHRDLHGEHRAGLMTLSEKLVYAQEEIARHVAENDRMLRAEREAREKLARRMTQQQNDIALEQLDRVDALMNSEKRLCTTMLMQQTREQAEAAIADEATRIRAQLRTLTSLIGGAEVGALEDRARLTALEGGGGPEGGGPHRVGGVSESEVRDIVARGRKAMEQAMDGWRSETRRTLLETEQKAKEMHLDATRQIEALREDTERAIAKCLAAASTMATKSAKASRDAADGASTRVEETVRGLRMQQEHLERELESQRDRHRTFVARMQEQHRQDAEDFGTRMTRLSSDAGRALRSAAEVRASVQRGAREARRETTRALSDARDEFQAQMARQAEERGKAAAEGASPAAEGASPAAAGGVPAQSASAQSASAQSASAQPASAGSTGAGKPRPPATPLRATAAAGASGVRTSTSATGETVHRLENGIEITVHKDGKQTQRNPDGSTICKLPDGTKTTDDGDVKITHFPDGRTLHVFRDGTRITTQPGGEKLQENPNGSTITTRTDGVRIMRRADGVVFEHYTDGRVVQRSLDGSVIEKFGDGRRRMTLPNGQVRELK